MIELYQGDCLEIMPTLKEHSVDMVLCDLPFGTTEQSWDAVIPMDKLWAQYHRVLTNKGIVALFANGIFTPKVMMSNIDEYKYRWVWVKHNSTNFVHAKNRPLTKSEDILIFSKAPMGHKSLLGDKRMTYNPQGLIECHKTVKAGKGRFGTVAGARPSHKTEFEREYTNYPSDVLTSFPEVSAWNKLHTNQKPTELLEYLILTYTNDGETVMDNTMGSGSTGVACVHTQRSFIGIERDMKYFQIAKNRIEQSQTGDLF